VRYDVHQHLWPEGFVAALEARQEAPYLRGGELVTPEGASAVDLAAHDPEHRLALLDRDGIDVAVLSLQPSLGIEQLAGAERDELELTWLEGVRELVAAAGGRFRVFAPWRVSDECVGTSVGASALLDPDLAPSLLAAIDAAGGVLFVHPESQDTAPAGRPAWWNWTAGYTGQMQRAYLAWLADGRDRFPSVRVVFAILAGGAPVQHERLVHRGVDVRTTLDPDTLFDTASYGRRAIELCIETFGVERLVYGSDTPVIDTQQTLDAVRGLGDSVVHILQTDTPGRLFS
jgi:predicted TIM-barrel fold metal-dependent hydrolase